MRDFNNEKNKETNEEEWLPEKEASALDYDTRLKELFDEIPVC
ncbi:hypothetical protein [Vibrio lentus]|nr:hypothetical protein [Vibrio lentus]